MRQLRHASFAAIIASAAVLICNPVDAAVRAFVASTGNDANTASQCGPTTPCRSFTAAMGIVDAGGEIIALDAAGYGAVTVTKSVTITANPGFYAGIAASSGVAVTIATTGARVVLRGLNINNIGTSITGIFMTDGALLVVENCVISNFHGQGIAVAAAAEVRVANTTIRDNYDALTATEGATVTVSGSRIAGHTAGQGGILVLAPTGTTTTLSVSDSVFSGNFVAIYSCASSGGTTHVAVTGSTFATNTHGVANDSCTGTQLSVVGNNQFSGNGSALTNFGGAIQSLGNNVGAFNSVNTTNTVTAVSGF